MLAFIYQPTYLIYVGKAADVLHRCMQLSDLDCGDQAWIKYVYTLVSKAGHDFAISPC